MHNITGERFATYYSSSMNEQGIGHNIWKMIINES